MSTPDIDSFISGTAQNFLKSTCDRNAEQCKSNIRRRIIHNEPSLLHRSEKIRTDRSGVNQETDGLCVDVVGMAI